MEKKDIADGIVDGLILATEYGAVQGSISTIEHEISIISTTSLKNELEPETSLILDALEKIRRKTCSHEATKNIFSTINVS